MTVSARIFEPGSLVQPIAGTVRWKDGVPAGPWCDERNAIGLYVLKADGTVRPANRAERRMAVRIWLTLRRPRP